MGPHLERYFEKYARIRFELNSKEIGFLIKIDSERSILKFLMNVTSKFSSPRGSG